MELMELLKTRRTYRRFEQKPVSEEILQEILLAARYASSAANKQPISYVVVKEPEQVKEVFGYTRWAGYLPAEQGQPKEGEEPVLFIGVVENVEMSSFCDTDAGLAIGNMTLAAWNHGVGSCIIGACNKPKLSEMFGLTEHQKLHSVVAFGYPSHKSYIEDMKEGDVKYYLNENRDYVVPKRKLEDLVKYDKFSCSAKGKHV
ncbi:MAG: nitroreductase family protein [Muricoprocola sp.]